MIVIKYTEVIKFLGNRAIKINFYVEFIKKLIPYTL